MRRVAAHGITAALTASDASAATLSPPTAMPPAELAWWHHMQAQLPRAQNSSIWFNESFGSSMVLQQAPASACVYGLLGEGGTAATVTLSSALGARRSVAATVNGSGWKACLPPHAAGGDYNVSARCEGCTVPGVATLEHVTFGDVWYCGGQSNMALKMLHTFSRNVSRDKVLAGAYANIRIHGLHSNQLNPTQPWSTLRDALATEAAPREDALLPLATIADAPLAHAARRSSLPRRHPSTAAPQRR